jgi:hypothetical protein
MNATNLESAPKSSAIMTITEAAPGRSPHIAVVPGNIPILPIPQPSATLAIKVIDTVQIRIGHWAINTFKIS